MFRWFVTFFLIYFYVPQVLFQLTMIIVRMRQFNIREMLFVMLNSYIRFPLVIFWGNTIQPIFSPMNSSLFVLYATCSCFPPPCFWFLTCLGGVRKFQNYQNLVLKFQTFKLAPRSHSLHHTFQLVSFLNL